MKPGARLAWIRPDDPPDAFPDPGSAFDQPNGLLAAGGDLSPERLLAAYSRGIFPWYSAGEPILWWCPDPRAVLLPRNLHVSRRLARTARSGRFTVSVNQAFGAVIHACATTRAEAATWLTPEMIAAYCRLHELGLAHSVESWSAGRLTGGVYGISLGSIFFGESMVSLVPDGSKIALLKLTTLAVDLGIELIDCQVPNPHLLRLGAVLMPRRDFLAQVSRGTRELPLRRLQAEPAGAVPLRP